ncbi:MAG TPA: phage tail sheath C-terminal domain-containing protein [Blastocatellia bacterium]|nr:phage tail sheath C-terminal domain-containing protein [Blastocatellia bacterium]
MPQYLSPGVYVEEVPSAVKAIAGVGTSTAGFIGVVGNKLTSPLYTVTNETPVPATDPKEFLLSVYPVVETAGTFEVRVNGKIDATAKLDNDDPNKRGKVIFTAAPAAGASISVDYMYEFTPVDAGVVKLCTTFSDYKKFFGDFSADAGHRKLTHAVYGFFNNGGTRCYVMRVATEDDLPKFLVKFEAIDEIAVVAAPGLIAANTRSALVIHCQTKTQDRFAILDSDETIEDADHNLDLIQLARGGSKVPPDSDYAAFYVPWIQVFDPVEKLTKKNDGLVFVPPSGHLAGIYARVDTERGVFKAPANEPVLGALGLKYRISKAQQDGLNPHGVNCIRDLNGNLTVWGARTVGGDANADLKYINVRRTLLFLRESIDEGTQWVVFEPNTPALWQKITRNVTAFLTGVWRSGALFGTTEQEAFFVKCDAENNPPEQRELGQVVTEIGVAIVRPAEFVIFRISQFSAPGK